MGIAEWSPLIEVIQSGGVLAIMLFGAWAVQTGKLVPGRYYDAVVREKDEWRTMALENKDLASRAVNAGETAVKAAKK